MAIRNRYLVFSTWYLAKPDPERKTRHRRVSPEAHPEFLGPNTSQFATCAADKVSSTTRQDGAVPRLYAQIVLHSGWNPDQPPDSQGPMANSQELIAPRHLQKLLSFYRLRMIDPHTMTLSALQGFQNRVKKM